MTRHIYLLRHCQTYGNAAGILNGVKIDRGLTKKGAAQSRQIAKSMKLRPRLILCSPQKRAMLTAKPIAERFGCKIAIVKQLHEQDSGGWTGMKIATIQKKFPEAFVRHGARMTRIFSYSPGGETMGEMEKRLKKVVAIVKGKYRGKDPILIVTHGVVIRLFLFMTGKKKTLGAAMAQNVRNGDIVRVRI